VELGGLKLLKHALLQGFLLEEEYLQLYEALELRNRLSHIYKLAPDLYLLVRCS
jgi:hypothetical protein